MSVLDDIGLRERATFLAPITTFTNRPYLYVRDEASEVSLCHEGGALEVLPMPKEVQCASLSKGPARPATPQKVFQQVPLLTASCSPDVFYIVDKRLPWPTFNHPRA